ncbi:MAG: hypothetical protein IKL79_04735 [Clostridia bacterium]|nr:hypothetical protein [Clostridia bacterium]
MDNKDVLEMEESVNTKQKVTAGRVVHITAAIILLVAATVAIAFTIYFGVEFFVTRAEHNALEGTGESQLGTGIAQAFLIVFTLIGVVVSAALSIISLVLSITVFKYREGREKTFGLVSIILNGAYILTALVLFFVIILI